MNPARETRPCTQNQDLLQQERLATESSFSACAWAFILTFMLIACSQALEAARPLESADAPAESSGVAVEIDGRPILLVYARIGGFTPEERARSIERRLVGVAKNTSILADDIHAENRGTWTEIIAGGNRIMGITEEDASDAEKSRAELASEYTEIVRQVVKQYREDHTVARMIKGVSYAIVATGICVLSIVALFKLRKTLSKRVADWLSRAEHGTPAEIIGVRVGHFLGQPLLAISHAAFWILLLALIQAYGTLILRFFPATRYTSYQLTNWLLSELARFGKNIIGYLPDLILLAFICLTTSYFVRLNHYFFGEIREGKLNIRGFYPDWAEPTAKLVRALILVASVIVAFPYLPGSDSPAFKGFSVFFGVLLSLGSTSAVAHGVAGTILTYMRAFQVGDFVRIGNDVGEVSEKTLLVTRICTQKNEVITIPNSTVLGGVVVNYSAEALKRGVIFHTVVTIGYSAPWRQVHELLLSAALATEGVLHDPAPFVLETALNDFYVSYELNVYTAKPREMQNIYSVLHQNIQDKFNEAGVEINSPHYAALRDGNQTTLPERYVPKEYKHPVFEVREIDPSQPHPAIQGHKQAIESREPSVEVMQR